MDKFVCYNLPVAPTFEKKDVPVTMKLPATIRDKIEQIGQSEDRPIGYVARELMLRGLALYNVDGKLRDDQKGKVSMLTKPIKLTGQQRTKKKVNHR